MINPAAFYFNENVARSQKRTKEGEKQYCVSYLKGRHGRESQRKLKLIKLSAGFMFIYKYLKKNYFNIYMRKYL